MPGIRTIHSESFEKQLSRYAVAASAAGVSALALTMPANARIVFTPSHTKLTPNHKLFLDLNHDGIKDFELLDGGSGSSFALDINPLHTGNAIVQANTDCNPLPGAAALKAGAVIGKNNVFGDYYCMAQYIGADSGSLGSWAGGVKNRFLGLQFTVKGKAHFGWVRLSVTAKPYVATLNGYAYETVPNKPIVAGKTKGSADQVGALGSLAQGALQFSPSAK